MNNIIRDEFNQNFYNIAIPIISPVFVVYLTMGMALGTLPAFILNDLKFNSFIVGLVIGIQSLATLLTRAYSGKISDTKGPKNSKLLGVILVAVAGLSYTIAIFFSLHHILALILLLIARILHGISESLLVTGALAWGIGLVGHEKSGKFMTWNGIAMYAGITMGAPLGILITNYTAIQYTFYLTILLPILSWLATSGLPATNIDKAHIRTSFYEVVNLIARQGLGLGLSSVAFGCISSFIALLFMEKSWGDPSLAFAAFGFSYIIPRLFFSSLPDKYGGHKITIISLCIEIIGQLLIAFSSSKAMAIIGCSLTGIGFSLIFPALGVLIIKKVTPQNRGTALGAYAAFFDLSLGLTVPFAGLIAGWFSYQAIYFLGSISCLLALLVATYKKRNY
jgi:MFS family permease